MKLQKAIDRARMKKEKSVLKKPIKSVATSTEVKPDDNGKPPVYSDSAAVELNEKLVRENRCVCLSTDAPELDFYKVLRTQILHRSQEKGWNTIMVTSTRPGEGKTLTSINLALTFAKAYGHVLLQN